MARWSIRLPCAMLMLCARSVRTAQMARGLAAKPSRASAFARTGGLRMATVERAAGSAKLGTHGEHPAFDLVRVDTVDEYGAVCGLYKHKRTGAEVLSVIADEPNKVFGIVFRTPPADSTGVPHILEHSVLCGSRKFPTKDPFVELLKGSLQTFLNAFTYPDRTCYPVASQNLKDFYNLCHVYLDAVLHPRAVRDPLVLQQEGWHLELDAPEEPLTYKGVVYNEMKGVYSNPEAVMMRVTQQALFPDTTYGVDSGGTPSVIPELTFDAFKAFHERFYHPANSRVFFYGDDPPAARLDLLDSYLSEFGPSAPDSLVAWQPLKAEPWVIEERFPATAETADKHMVSVNWVLHDRPMSLRDTLAWGILDHLLLGTSASTLAKALTDSDLGEDLVGGGLSDELQQATFGIGLKGVKKEDMPKVESLVVDVLKQVAAEGFDPEAVAASINTVEFSLREFNTGGFPRGLSFMLGAMSEWLYDRDPLSGLRFEEPLAELKAALEKGEPVFEDLVKRTLLENGHCVTVRMVPDTELEARQLAEESDKLAGIKKSMTPEQLEAVQEATKALKARQAEADKAEDVAKLPKLGLEDLDKEGQEIPCDVRQEGPVTFLTHALPTSGIVYADVCFDAKAVSLEELPLLPLLTACFLEMGTEGKDRVKLSREIGTHTGGMGTTTLLAQPSAGGGLVSPADGIVSYVCVRGKAVVGEAARLFDLIREVATECRLDDQRRVVEMLKETVAGFRASIPAAGHTFADTRIRARHAAAAYVAEQTSGLSAFEHAKALLKEAEEDWPALSARLQQLRAKLVAKEGMVINLTADEKTLGKAMPHAEALAAALPGAGSPVPARSPWCDAPLESVPVNEGIAVPTQVNYVGRGGALYQPGEKVPGSASVVARYLRTGYLWDTIRVMGGAYGGFCRLSPQSGLFTYLSYRDPNLKKSVDNYDGAAQHLQGLAVTEEVVAQSVIGAIGDLDRPMQPDAKGFASLQQYLVGETAGDRKALREEVLATSAKDFKALGERLEALSKEATTTVVGSRAAIEAANKELPVKLTVKECS